MNINDYGAVFLTPEELFENLYSGKIKNFNNIFVDDSTEIKKFNNAIKENFDEFQGIKVYENPKEDLEFFDKTNQRNWFMPEDYCPNLIEMLYGMCETQEQTDRVSLELELFIQHGMLDLLYYHKYLVDTMREKNILWGVGRGSSVASYVLYLIGVHKIDSIKYDLDIKEFLK